MGIWGCGLYQDDVTCDVKSNYLNWLRVGKTNEEATELMLEYYEDYIDDEDDAPPFWFALADTQWKYGRLHPKVKKEALRYLKLGTSLERWKEENPKLFPKRKKVLEELKKRLESPMPPEKKVTKLRMSHAKWKVGDVLLYQIHSNSKSEEEFVNASKWNGKYILIRVIAISYSNIGSLPRDKYYDSENKIIVYNWVGNEPPNLEIINRLEFLPSRFQWLYRWSSFILSGDQRHQKALNFQLVMEDNKYPKPTAEDASDLNTSWVNDNVFGEVIIRDLDYNEQMGILNDQTK